MASFVVVDDVFRRFAWAFRFLVAWNHAASGSRAQFLPCAAPSNELPRIWKWDSST